MPEPKNDEVRIRLEAFALNYGDFGLMDNDYPFLLDFSATLGDEMCGIVDAIGPGVSQFSMGDRLGSLPWMWAFRTAIYMLYVQRTIGQVSTVFGSINSGGFVFAGEMMVRTI